MDEGFHVLADIENDVILRWSIFNNETLEYQDDEFQTCMRKLQQCSLKFEDMPIYIINEKVAAELCYDQLRGYEENERSDI